jgi:hypothetical protein
MSERPVSLSIGVQLLLEQLQDKVSVYVWKRRALGVPVECIIPELHHLMREATAGEKYLYPTDRILTRMVRCIESEYDEPDLRGAPRFY